MIPGDLGRSGDAGLGLRPLTARSVILSVLLGAHPPLLPVRGLVRTAELFGISEGTARVALSRLVAEGEVVADHGQYRLSDRLADRQRLQDEGHAPMTRPWRGTWELAVLAPEVRTAAARATVASEMSALHLAELRSGMWVRPANLRRQWPLQLVGRVWRFEARAADRGLSDLGLSAALWDLSGWADRADALIRALRAADEPARRFVIAAAMVRHLRLDPLLPPALLPARWPGQRLRVAYDGYAAEMRSMLWAEQARHHATRRARTAVRPDRTA